MRLSTIGFALHDCRPYPNSLGDANIAQPILLSVCRIRWVGIEQVGRIRDRQPLTPYIRSLRLRYLGSGFAGYHPGIARVIYILLIHVRQFRISAQRFSATLSFRQRSSLGKHHDYQELDRPGRCPDYWGRASGIDDGNLDECLWNQYSDC